MNELATRLRQQPFVAQQFIVLLMRVAQLRRQEKWHQALIELDRLELLIRDMRL